MEKRLPEQSPDPNNFDAWLTGLPDEELVRLGNISDQVFAENFPEDTTELANLFATAMRFRGSEAMSVEEVGRTFQMFATQLAVERLVRDGDATKEGEYSMNPDGKARFTVTEKGKQVYGGGIQP